MVSAFSYAENAAKEGGKKARGVKNDDLHKRYLAFCKSVTFLHRLFG